jgi:glycosyltransferase involved in cell wall biosynthesis
MALNCNNSNSQVHGMVGKMDYRREIVENGNNLVSIIVPIYNAELYLHNCIESILGQTYKLLEIILINDGSIDNSKNICEEYARRDLRIRVIHQKNSGPSIARNTGMLNAKGYYIQFVDSDDVIEPNTTEKLVIEMKKEVDLVICGLKSSFKYNDKVITKNNFSPIEGIYQIEEFGHHFGDLYRNNLINSPCNKLYKSEVIKKYNIIFNDDIEMGEDLLFNLEYIKHCNNVGIINDQLYNYLNFNNTDSLTSDFKKDYWENQQMLYRELEEFLNNNFFTKQNKYIIDSAYANTIIACMENLFHKNSNLSSKDKHEKIVEIISDKQVRNNVECYLNNTIQNRIIRQLFKNKCSAGLYLYFNFKNFLRFKLYKLFNMLKKMNK